MGLSMADAVARLGAVDHVAVGLSDFWQARGIFRAAGPRWLLAELESHNALTTIRAGYR